MRSELVDGPMDGDHRSSLDDELYFTSETEGYVNYYQRVDGGDFKWQGLIPWREGIRRVWKLEPGMKS